MGSISIYSITVVRPSQMKTSSFSDTPPGWKGVGVGHKRGHICPFTFPSIFSLYFFFMSTYNAPKEIGGQFKILNPRKLLISNNLSTMLQRRWTDYLKLMDKDKSEKNWLPNRNAPKEAGGKFSTFILINILKERRKEGSFPLNISYKILNKLTGITASLALHVSKCHKQQNFQQWPGKIQR